MRIPASCTLSRTEAAHQVDDQRTVGEGAPEPLSGAERATTYGYSQESLAVNDGG
jgi:hypothetical protein